MDRLQQTREHDRALLLVLVAKLLAVGLLLAPAPGPHVVHTDGDEKDEAGAARRDNDARPRDDLEHVVGARHEPEREALGQLALRLTGLAQAGQVLVDAEVADLAEEEECNAQVRGEGLGGVCGGREGRVHLERAEGTGSGPVKERIPEDVCHGHGAGRELVHKDGLVLALEEVQHNHGEASLLRERELLGD